MKRNSFGSGESIISVLLLEIIYHYIHQNYINLCCCSWNLDQIFPEI